MALKNTTLNLSAGLASVTVALTLVALKLWALGATSALSVAASLADSALDLTISLVGLTAIVYAARPPDEDHAFGHTSVEDLAALTQALCVLASAGVIAWFALTRLLGGAPSTIGAEESGIAVLVLSIGLTLALVFWQRHVARKTGNRVVAADSLHYMADLLPSLGAILALWASHQFGLHQLDSLIALAAAAFLTYGALRIGARAWDALMDRSADPAIIEGIATITCNWPGVHGFHDLKTRTAGSRIFVHLHIELDGALSLRDAHDIGAALRRKLLEAYPACDIIIHKDVAE